MNLSRSVFPSRLFRYVPLALSAALLAADTPLLAQGTKLWTQSRFEEFEKGTPQGVEITSDGKLRSGPIARETLTTPSSFVWSVATDKAGTVFLATGSPATVLRVSPADQKSAKTRTLFETKALAVQVVRVGPDGTLYAATIPDGKVYRIKPDSSKALDESTAEVVFDLGKAEDETSSAKPDAKGGEAAKPESKSRYIWDMSFDKAGELYIATGGPGVVYRVDPAVSHPKAEAFFKSDEQHIRVLAWDKSGNLLAGSDGSGLVYRIDSAGKGYVLFSAPRREITALTVGDDGTVYAADVGDKSRNPLPQLPIQNGASSITISFVQPGSVQAANASTSLPEGTEIFALKPDQAPRKLWSGKDEIVYRLAYTGEGIVALTGNRGRILKINSKDGRFSDIAHLEAQQAVSMMETANGWLVGTANTGKLYRLENEGGTAKNGGAHSYASDVLDAGATARWGRVEAEPGSRGYEIWTRSGNVEQPVRSAKDWGWSEWQRTVADKIVSPVGRYLQWKAVLSDGGEVAGVGVNYLTVNAAPVVDDVVVVPGARVTPQPQQANPPTVQIAFPNPAQNTVVVFDPNAANAGTPIPAQKDRGAVTVRWAAHDDNGDELTYDLYLRGDGEQAWRLLKKGLTEKVYSFDAASFPDGGYQVKVVASDAPSHTPGEVLTGEEISERFELDTTAPAISELKAGAARPIECVKTGVQAPCPQRMTIPVSFEATDAASPIAKAEYSLDAGPWQFVEPVGGLSDAKEERYSFAIPLPGGIEVEPEGAPKAGVEAEHLVTVRVYDRHENVATAKVLVPGGGGKAER